MSILVWFHMQSDSYRLFDLQSIFPAVQFCIRSFLIDILWSVRGKMRISLAPNALCSFGKRSALLVISFESLHRQYWHCNNFFCPLSSCRSFLLPKKNIWSSLTAEYDLMRPVVSGLLLCFWAKAGIVDYILNMKNNQRTSQACMGEREIFFSRVMPNQNQCSWSRVSPS